MLLYRNARRFDCTDQIGNRYVVVEQICDAAPRERRIDYMTEDGDIADRLDEHRFLLLMKDKIVEIRKRK